MLINFQTSENLSWHKFDHEIESLNNAFWTFDRLKNSFDLLNFRRLNVYIFQLSISWKKSKIKKNFWSPEKCNFWSLEIQSHDYFPIFFVKGFLICSYFCSIFLFKFFCSNFLLKFFSIFCKNLSQNFISNFNLTF